MGSTIRLSSCDQIGRTIRLWSWDLRSWSSGRIDYSLVKLRFDIVWIRLVKLSVSQVAISKSDRDQLSACQDAILKPLRCRWLMIVVPPVEFQTFESINIRNGSHKSCNRSINLGTNRYRWVELKVSVGPKFRQVESFDRVKVSNRSIVLVWTDGRFDLGESKDQDTFTDSNRPNFPFPFGNESIIQVW